MTESGGPRSGGTESTTKPPETGSEPVVVILAGGAGTRFWPASTHDRPKQFLPLLGERSLLQESCDRALNLARPERILVLTNADYVEQTRHQLPGVPSGNVIAEPMRRDTAAAICLGALLLERMFGSTLMVVLTADHRIEPDAEFTRVIESASRAAEATEALYTVGIPPREPATAYGYLEGGDPLLVDNGIVHRAVRSFREKPDRATAVAYLESGRYAWNSGMFAWRTDAVLGEFARHLPEHLRTLSPVAAMAGEREFEGMLAEAFARLPAISVDYGIMEKATDVRMVEATFSWSDLGGWNALAEFLPDDGDGNRHRSRLATHRATANVAYSDDPDELIALVGVSDLVVVRAGRRTLVASRDRVEEVKELVGSLERDGRLEDL